jgi:hypothetical protein
MRANVSSPTVESGYATESLPEEHGGSRSFVCGMRSCTEEMISAMLGNEDMLNDDVWI